MSHILFVLATFGATNALVFLHVGHPVRKLVSGMSDSRFRALAQEDRLRGVRQVWLGRAVRCHACCSFWIGAGLSLMWWDLPAYGWQAAWEATMAGLVSSASCFAIWVLLRWMGAEEL